MTNKTVAEMEDKLPREERLEWAKQMCTVTGNTRFEKFRNFLRSRKSVLESVELMGCRSGGDDSVGSRCEYCNRPGHTADRCFIKQRDQGGQAGGGFIPKGRGGCAICNGEDHWKNECPEKGSAKDKRSGRKANSLRGNQGGRGGQGGQVSGGGGVGGAVSAEVGSNTLRAQECPRCKAASKMSYCAGCHKTSSITHCLLHCESYMVLFVKDRADLVRSSKTCAICLHSSHTADKCFNKDNDNYVCGVGGCQSHHHPSLHGSKDIYVTGVNVLLRCYDREHRLLQLHVRMHFFQLVIGWIESSISMIAFSGRMRIARLCRGSCSRPVGKLGGWLSWRKSRLSWPSLC